MCCSVTPGVDVKFSDTILYAAEARNPEGGYVHVLGYQNVAQNDVLGFDGWSLGRIGKLVKTLNPFRKSPTGGNAMILPFPALPGTMTRDNVLDAEKCPALLDDMRKAVRHPVAAASSVQSASFSLDPVPKIQIFDAAGIYTVVLARDARAIPDALAQVPSEKRPALNKGLFDDYAQWYPDWTIALCCFNNAEAKRALPMLWWYEPMSDEELFLPTLDAHDGNSPDLDANVTVDHTIVVSTYRPGDDHGSGENAVYPKRFYPVEFKDAVPPQLEHFVMDHVIGRDYYDQMRNGDMYCVLKAVRNGTFDPFRRLPPGA